MIKINQSHNLTPFQMHLTPNQMQILICCNNYDCNVENHPFLIQEHHATGVYQHITDDLAYSPHLAL